MGRQKMQGRGQRAVRWRVLGLGRAEVEDERPQQLPRHAQRYDGTGARSPGGLNLWRPRFNGSPQGGQARRPTQPRFLFLKGHSLQPTGRFIQQEDGPRRRPGQVQGAAQQGLSDAAPGGGRRDLQGQCQETLGCRVRILFWRGNMGHVEGAELQPL
ncbi:hypothetical protein GCM10010841_04100 [Deinococcus aerophilus]|uniref:Uncharacterized protein n=1 Tax=Deinococcus aerophilus TaxID=522488 RepID=A0ABQ2GJR5_9DEIO|nr:hypothetical protein GCM10010841_04100 [Deinococcus aerophilus]